MSAACPSCRRPVPLTPEEIVTLRAAVAASCGGIAAEGVAPAVLRALVRMGYMVKLANDDRHRRPMALITERGRDWLAGKLD